MAGVDYESVLCVKPQVHVFRIPPRSSNRGYRAADWKLDQPDWSGRLRLVAKGRELNIKLEDKNSGDLFAKCPIDTYPGIAVESVTDSSRYFVLRIMDDNGRSAFIGIGFEDRGDSFDLNVALQDHFKHLKQEKEAQASVDEPQKGPKLDLGFKEGQTIRINISTKKNGDEGTPKKERPKGAAGGGLGLLPPPPGGGFKLPPPGGESTGHPLPAGPKRESPSHTSVPINSNFNTVTQTGNANSGSGSNVDMLLDLDFGGTSHSQSQSSTVLPQGNTPSSDFGTSFDLLSSSTASSGSGSVAPAGGPSDPWGEFASASSDTTSDDWVQF